MTLTKISRVKEIMGARGLRPKRRWGQNFLKERGLLNLMVREGEVEPGEVVLEIGPGPGCLTESLLAAGARVLAVEIDAGLLAVARELLGDPLGVRWLLADILEGGKGINPSVLDLLEGEIDSSPFPYFKVIANLPYNGALSAVVALLESPLPCSAMVVMVQNEVADRLLARPGAKEYGLTSVFVSALAKVERLRIVQAVSFWPRPAVDSSLIKIIPFPSLSFDRVPYEDFKRAARGVFAHRRKVWIKSLLIFLEAVGEEGLRDVLLDVPLDRDLRAESLAPEDILEIAGKLCEFREKGGGKIPRNGGSSSAARGCKRIAKKRLKKL